MSRLTIIVAATKSNGIGQAGKLPWRLPKEIKYFAQVTSNAPEGKHNAVIMGRNTWESIPKKFRPLPGRLNVVITSQVEYDPGVSTDDTTSEISKPFIASNLQSALARLNDPNIHRAFIIGGAYLYRETLKLAPAKPSFAPTKFSFASAKPSFAPAKFSFAPAKPSFAPAKFAPAKFSFAPAKPSFAPAKFSFAPAKLSLAPAKFSFAPAKLSFAPAKLSLAPATSSHLDAATDSTPYVDRILLTRVVAPEFEDCDVFMPEFRGPEFKGSLERTGKWVQASHAELREWVGVDVVEGVQEENGVKYEFQMWTRDATEQAD